MKILRFVRDCWVDGVFYAADQPVAFRNPPSSDLIGSGDAVEVFDLGCWTDHESRLSNVIELNESHDQD